MMEKKLAVLLVVVVCLAGYFVMSAWANEREIDALHEQAAAILREAKEHASRGHADEARELESRAQTLRAKAAELLDHSKQAAPEKREHQERLLTKRPEEFELRERRQHGHEQIEHLRQAAEHLHAAGMQEMAAKLLHEAELRRRELDQEREFHHDEGLRRHIEELTKHVHELRERLERMERAVQTLSDRREG